MMLVLISHSKKTLRRIDLLLGNDSKNTFPLKRTRATTGRPLVGNGSVNKPSQQERGCVFFVFCAEGL
jgi:hypothetical protein